MKKQASPRLIGAFVVLAFLVLAVLVGLVGSFKAFKSRQTFVVYFKGSVNNLNVGAKVKWKGVPVGQVSDIRIRWNQDVLSTDIPVFVQLDLDRLGMRLDEENVMKREVESGLRARTQMESLISGMLYIDLDYLPDTAPPRYLERERIYPEIPAAPSPFDEIGDLAFKIADNIANVDFKRISDNLNASLEKVNKALDDLDAAGMSRSVKSAANSVTSLAGSPKVTALLDDAARTMTALRTLAETLNRVGGPLPEQIAALSAQAGATMKAIQSAADTLRDSAATDSDTLRSLNDALEELSSAARSVRDLADFLERNPGAILGGRAGNGEPEK